MEAAPPRHHEESHSSALQALKTIIQLHFEKTLEKKRLIDVQKKQLWKLYHLFFILLSLVLFALTRSPTNLRCRHAWIPILFLSFAHLIFYLSVAQTLRCINGFKYQRRCHKLTLGVATEKLRQLNLRLSGRLEVRSESSLEDGDVGADGVLEIRYQEPPESYFGKFMRNWARHFGFILLVYAFMVSSSVVLLCY
uniref:Transmembrane protein n=1 Tax=Kalanchoe fedtschenkoi TaxID=63787 RepID=A0A7N0ZQN5_KALFE